MKPIRNLFLSICALLGMSLIVGCQTTMTGITPSSTPITGNDSYTTLGEGRGKSFGFMVVGIPYFEGDLANPRSTLSKLSLDRAIRDSGGTAMIEVTQDYTTINLSYVQIFYCTTRGTGVNIERNGRLLTDAAVPAPITTTEQANADALSADTTVQ